MSFPSNLGLRNHTRQHQRGERELEIRLQLPTPGTCREMRDTRRRNALSTSSDDDEEPVPSGASVASSEARASTVHSPVRHLSSPAPRSPVYVSANSTPINSPGRLTPMAGSTSSSSPAPSTIGDASPTSDLLTQDVPDNPSPALSPLPANQQADDNDNDQNDNSFDHSTILDQFEPAIQYILNDDTNDANWVRFSIILDKYHVSTHTLQD